MKAGSQRAAGIFEGAPMYRSIIRRVTLAVGAVVLAAVATVTLSASPASASAYGCTGYGTGINWQGVDIKNGVWCGSIVGNGTYVNYVTGNFYTHLVPLDQICNFSERADFYRSNGSYYGYVQTPTYYRCSNASDFPNVYLNQNVPAGYVMMRLMSNGGIVASVKENIS